jgi:hypothetical protein
MSAVTRPPINTLTYNEINEMSAGLPAPVVEEPRVSEVNSNTTPPQAWTPDRSPAFITGPLSPSFAPGVQPKHVSSALPMHSPAEPQPAVNHAQPAFETTGTAPMVVATWCPLGHPNPVYTALCRVCGKPVPPQEPYEIPRPTLGILRLPGGEILTLERGVVFGRNPHPVPGATGLAPNLIRIDDPSRDISNQHLEIGLEGWFVTARDLNSTNGTQMILPSKQRVALRANEPVTLELGTAIDLAGAFRFTFEATL